MISHNTSRQVAQVIYFELNEFDEHSEEDRTRFELLMNCTLWKDGRYSSDIVEFKLYNIFEYIKFLNSDYSKDPHSKFTTDASKAYILNIAIQNLHEIHVQDRLKLHPEHKKMLYKDDSELIHLMRASNEHYERVLTDYCCFMIRNYENPHTATRYIH